MKNKVLILGAGIGAMTIGFENAGCSVDGAYEKDKRAIGLYEKNVNKEADGYDHFFFMYSGENSGYRYIGM